MAKNESMDSWLNRTNYTPTEKTVTRKHIISSAAEGNAKTLWSNAELLALIIKMAQALLTNPRTLDALPEEVNEKEILVYMLIPLEEDTALAVFEKTEDSYIFLRWIKTAVAN